MLGLLIRRATATVVVPGAARDYDGLCCFRRAEDPGKHEAWQQLVALLGPSNVEVADGDALAISSILDTMTMATTQTQKMQLMAIAAPAFKQASCCVGISAHRMLGRAFWHKRSDTRTAQRLCHGTE